MPLSHNLILVFERRLKEYGIDIKKFACWSKIDELRLVANTVKHAEGSSSQKLRNIRPDLFKNPYLSGFLGLPVPNPQIFQPLFGDDLYVSLQDVKGYRDQLIQFWEKFADALRCD